MNKASQPNIVISWLFTTALTVANLANPAFAAPIYTITDLGTLGGSNSIASSINNTGQVAGYFNPGTGSSHAFLYNNGSMSDLGTLGGSLSYANGINDAGQVVGFAATASGHGRAFLYNNGSMSDLGTLGGIDSDARGINNAGQVVGTAATASGYGRAFLYNNGSMSDLGTLGGIYSGAVGINNAGQVVGTAATASGYGRAFLYNNGSMSDLGTLGGIDSGAVGINNIGQVVGSANTAAGNSHAFLYNNGSMSDLGTLGGARSWATGINNIGQVVGSANTAAGNFHSFLYNNGRMSDLNTLLPGGTGWTLAEANAINDHGQIVGYGALNGSNHAFLMTPTGTTSSPIPTNLQLAQFSGTAYGTPNLVPGYQELALNTGSPSTPGFAAKAYKNAAGDRIVLAIRGTDDIQDLIGPDSAFLNPLGQPNSALRNYVGDAARTLQYLRANNPNAEITLTGHSLGGAIAQILANASGLSATTFDAPGAAQFARYLVDSLAQVSQSRSPQSITNYRIYGDLVSTVGTQFGSTITYAHPPDIPTWQIDQFSIGTAKPMHLLSMMIERIFNNAPIISSVGPTALSAGTGLASTILQPSIPGVIRQAVNAVVVAGDLLWIDPEGLDAYGLTRALGSPNFRSVLFPMLADVDAVFSLEEFNNGMWTQDGLFDELARYDFGPNGVDQFRFFVLDRNSMRAPTSVESFNFGVTFVSDGVFNGTLTAYSTQPSSVPEPPMIYLFLVALGALMFSSKFAPK